MKKTVEIDVDLLEDILSIARRGAYGSEWDCIRQADTLFEEFEEKSRPSNLDNLFNGPGYFSGNPVDTEENLE